MFNMSYSSHHNNCDRNKGANMKLMNELGLKGGFENKAHECILSVYFTGELIQKKACEFFADYGLTDIQFNLLWLLSYQDNDGKGLTQAELSKMMLVHRSNITGLIDRMKKADLVKRKPVPGDRRYNAVCLTNHGKKIFHAVEEKYMNRVSEIMGGLNFKKLNELMKLLERVRDKLK